MRTLTRSNLLSLSGIRIKWVILYFQRLERRVFSLRRASLQADGASLEVPIPRDGPCLCCGVPPSPAGERQRLRPSSAEQDVGHDEDTPARSSQYRAGRGNTREYILLGTKYPEQ